MYDTKKEKALALVKGKCCMDYSAWFCDNCPIDGYTLPSGLANQCADERAKENARDWLEKNYEVEYEDNI